MAFEALLSAAGYGYQAYLTYQQALQAKEKVKEVADRSKPHSWQEYVTCAASCVSAVVQGVGLAKSVQGAYAEGQYDQAIKDKDIKKGIADEKRSIVLEANREAKEMGLGQDEMVKRNWDHYMDRITASHTYEDSLEKCIGIGNQLQSIQKTVRTCNLIDSASQFSAEICQNDSFCYLGHNVPMINAALKAYASLHPDSKVGKLIKDRNLGASVALGFAVAKTAQLVHGLPDEIPDSLKNDKVFSKNICPVSLSPVRYPVVLKNASGKTFMFEEAEILRWCAMCEMRGDLFTNPLTREVFVLTDLERDFVTRKIIEDHLEELRPIWSKNS